MEKLKNADAGIQKLDAAQMSKIEGGGYWYVVRDGDGKVVRKIWIP